MTTQTLPQHPFWQFSLQTYNHETVKKALSQLQNDHGLNMNMILYCCWIGFINHGYLTHKDIKQLLRAIYPWHDRVVAALRRLRNRLTSLRQEILDTELIGEQVEQLILTDTLMKIPHQHRPLKQRLHDSCRNMASYCKVLHLAFDQRDFAAFCDLLIAIYPDLAEEEILTTCRTAFTRRRRLINPEFIQFRFNFFRED